LDRSPLSETREELVEVAREAEKPIYKYVLEESVMDFMRSITSRSEVQKAIRSGESQSIELKEDYPIATDIKKTAAGMANSEGGTIIFGIDEGIYGTRQEIHGVEDPESIISRVERRLREVQPGIDPEIRVEYLDNSPVVVVEIPAYQEIPHAVDGTFYIRRGTTTEYLHPQELREFFI
jgi:predicted HTH transcriptional regulator